MSTWTDEENAPEQAGVCERLDKLLHELGAIDQELSKILKYREKVLADVEQAHKEVNVAVGTAMETARNRA